ncbi:hypothetical protein HDU77_008343 [Chytriomyces hyalinus]|nr:hypothetical protein HDU77_008343 [Chytriomyces hyalinus]
MDDYDSDESDVPPWHEELPPPPVRPVDSDNEDLAEEPPLAAKERLMRTKEKEKAAEREKDADRKKKKKERKDNAKMANSGPEAESNTFGVPVQNQRKKKTLLDAVTHRQAPLYDNCRLYAQNGSDLMAMISRKRYRWYLKKGIAEVLDDHSIRITFEPRGPGGAEYGITEKANVCVVCGSDSKLFRTYIVPHSYRSVFPESMSASQSHDVVLQCANCFPKWAKASGAMRTQLAKDFNAPVNGVVIPAVIGFSNRDSLEVSNEAADRSNNIIPSDAPKNPTISALPGLDGGTSTIGNTDANTIASNIETIKICDDMAAESTSSATGTDINTNSNDKNDANSIRSSSGSVSGSVSYSFHVSAKSAAKALLKVGPSLPADRRASLLDRVSRFTGKDVAEITDADLELIMNFGTGMRHGGIGAGDLVKTHEQIVVEAFKGREQELIVKWRTLFLETCEPRFLPEFWRVDFVKEG